MDAVISYNDNLSISSNNENQTLAKFGDIVTIVLHANETLSDITGTIFDRTASITILDTVIIVSANILETDVGYIPFSISVSDYAGNSLTLTQSDLYSPNVLVDNTSPAKQNLDISSSNSNATLAKSGDTINVTLTASEPILNASVYHIARYCNGCGNKYGR